VCLSFLVSHLAQAGFSVLGESASRSSESLLPKREFEERSDVGLTRSPSERCDS